MFEGTRVPSFIEIMIDKGTIADLAQERIDELDNGCYLIDIHIDTANRIVVEVDNDHRGLSVEDCIAISRNIEHNLDREAEDFSLEVTSPGLSKPLKVWRQYKKNVGRNLKVQTAENEKKLEGKLTAADENGISLEVVTKERIEGRKKKEKITTEYKFNYNQITEAKVVISFK